MRKEKLGVKDSLVIIAISYYLTGDVSSIHSAYKRNKKLMSKSAKETMHMMTISKDPVAVLEAGLKEL